MTRLAYKHQAGIVYRVLTRGGLASMCPAECKAQLDAHRSGAARCGSWGANTAARISKDLADQLEHCIEAAEHYRKHLGIGRAA